MEHINKAKSWFFEKMKKNAETLPRRIKKKSEKTQKGKKQPMMSGSKTVLDSSHLSSILVKASLPHVLWVNPDRNSEV